MNPATDTKADDTLDEASFKTIAAATFLHPDAQAAEPRVHPCAICCTFFSGFAVLFLFVLAANIRARFPYMHIDTKDPHEAEHQANGTYNAGVIYIVFGVISILFWIKGYRRMAIYKQQKARAEAAEQLAS